MKRDKADLVLFNEELLATIIFNGHLFITYYEYFGYFVLVFKLFCKYIKVHCLLDNLSEIIIQSLVNLWTKDSFSFARAKETNRLDSTVYYYLIT